MGSVLQVKSQLVEWTGNIKWLLSVVLILAGFVAVLPTPAQAQQFAPLSPIAFTKPFQGSDPLPQTLTIASTGANFDFVFTSSTASGGNWLSVTAVGCGLCVTPTALTATVTASPTLAAGTYTGQIVVTPNSGGVSVVVPVALTVSSTTMPFFDSLPGQMSFSLFTGGAAPPSQVLEIRNGGAGTLNWTLSASTSDGGNWLSISAPSGTSPSLTTVGLSVNDLPGNGLVAGTYIGQLVLRAPGSSVTIPVSVTVGANVFAQVNAINFTKPFAGANPLPQTLTIASTRTNFDFVFTSSTATGGNWLTLSAVGCALCVTPTALTATVTASPTLAAGTYTGQIVVTSNNGAEAITVPVTLTVAASGAFFDNLPGQMSFALATGATAPPGQVIEIRNAGTGSLDWTLSGSTADGGNWLTASLLSGTAPSLVNIAITPQNLPGKGLVAGTFVGEIVLRAPGSSVTIPVSVTVGANVFAQVNAINFTKPFAGADPLPQTLTIASTGSNFDFVFTSSTATGGNWLTVSAVGCALCVTPTTLTATVTASPTLAAGTYTGQIVVTSNNGAQAITVPVTLTVAVGGAFFDNLPGEMSFSLSTGGATPPSQVIEIRNGGTGTLNWTLSASTSDGGNWLNISAPSGAAPSLVDIAITPQNLPGNGLVAGTYIGQLLLRAPGSSVTIPVSVTVGANVFAQVNAINFTKPFAGANPLPQTLTIASTRTNFDFVFTSSTATGGNWLTVSAVGCALCVTPTALTATVTASPTLAAGTYTGQIVVTSNNGAEAITVPVTLTVAASGAFFDNLPGQMSFALATGATAPPGQVIEIRNAGTGSLDWTLSGSTADGGNWLTASLLSGTAPSLVNIAITPQNLPGKGLVAGTFVGEIVFRAPGSSVTIPVSVTVGANVFAQVNAINFTKLFAGANPLPQTLTIASTGTNFDFVFTSSTATGGNWLTVSAVGCGLCVTPTVLTATVTASPTLAAGTYTGQIVVTSNNGAQAITVPVTLTVAVGGAFFDNLQGQMSFSLASHSGNPPSQTIQIRNEGSGTLNWTLTSTTADGGNWLSASAVNGTAPMTVSVSVAASALPGAGLVAGTFIGELVLRSSGSSVTIPVSVVVGQSVFIQLDTVSFTKPLAGANPTPQTLPIASTGTNFDFVFTSSTGNGGNWLTVTAVNCGLCVTPTALTAAVTATSLASGTYTGQIVATSNSGSEAMTIPVILTVAGNPPASITATSGTPQTAPVNTAFASPLVVKVTDANGAPVSNVAVTYTAPTSGASGTFAGGVSTVTTDSQGRAASPTFTANGTAGSYTVTATVGSLSTSFSLTNTRTLVSIAITAPSGSIAKGTSEQFTAIGTYSDNSIADITGQATWVSSSVGVATIAATGFATSVAPGPTNITASFSGITSNVFALTVTSPTLTSIAITAPSGSIAKGTSEQFTATGTYRDNSTANITSQATWSSSNSSVATITATGLAAAVATGSTNISASLGNVNSNVVPLTVTSATLSSIAITAPNGSIAKGTSEQFTATGTFSDNSTANITSQVTWSSSNSSVATITATGLAAAVATGSTNISASLGNVNSNVFPLTVTAATLSSIAITAPNGSIAKGTSEQFTATGTYSDNSTANITGQVTWSSSNSGVAIIAATGLATAVATGSTNISASLGNVTSNLFPLSVTSATLSSIAITAPNASIAKGTSEQFTATGTYSDNSTANITSQVTWTSSNTGAATISATGLATALAAGPTNITASLSGVTSNVFALTVTNPTLTSIAITAPSGSIAKGTSEQFTATGTYSDNSTANVTSQVTWTSSHSGVATIGATGLATAVTTGPTNITASLSGITSNIFPLTVTNPTLTLIAITAPSGSIAKGTSDQFTATGTYSDNSTANITSQVTWTSSNTGVANIGATGLATAIATGSTNISASLGSLNSTAFPLTVTNPTLTSIAITAPAARSPKELPSSSPQPELTAITPRPTSPTR